MFFCSEQIIDDDDDDDHDQAYSVYKHSTTFRVRRYVVMCTDCKSSNSAQLEGTLYHSPKLHPGLCSSVEMRRGTDRRAWPIYISRRLRLTRYVIIIITTYRDAHVLYFRKRLRETCKRLPNVYTQYCTVANADGSRPRQQYYSK